MAAGASPLGVHGAEPCAARRRRRARILARHSGSGGLGARRWRRRVAAVVARHARGSAAARPARRQRRGRGGCGVSICGRGCLFFLACSAGRGGWLCAPPRLRARRSRGWRRRPGPGGVRLSGPSRHFARVCVVHAAPRARPPLGRGAPGCRRRGRATGARRRARSRSGGIRCRRPFARAAPHRSWSRACARVARTGREPRGCLARRVRAR
mmetsp:Transcript_49224/g.159535  ORF Transcript_49224/g.159535 Transcript_49224/m.159535 type:complete len:211 (-) Transcript_49224:664-1296(-)